MAGTVNGNRQMNSTSRDIPGRRRRTHVIVGTNSASMITTVITLSPIEAMNPSFRAGYFVEISLTFISVFHVAIVRPPRRTLVVKSSMPINGSMKNARTTLTVTQRKIACLRRTAAR